MFKYFLSRLVQAVPVLVLVTVLVFGLMLIVPGDPAVTLAGENATPERIDAIRDSLNLNDPILTRYFDWVTAAIRGDLGDSIISGRSITESILGRVPVTASLAGASLLIALAIAVPAGVIAAVRRGRWEDRTVTVLSSVGLALPNFAVGLVLVLVFSIQLGVLPATGYRGLTSGVVEWAKHLILPAITLGTAAAAESARQLRASLGDSLQMEYVRTARAKGAGPVAVVMKHAMKNAAIPVVTVIGFQVAFLLGGSVVVEQIFALPGLGSFTYQAVINRDLPAIQGVVLFTAVVVIALNLFIDLLYGLINPKTRQ